MDEYAFLCYTCDGERLIEEYFLHWFMNCRICRKYLGKQTERLCPVHQKVVVRFPEATAKRRYLNNKNFRFRRRNKITCYNLPTDWVLTCRECKKQIRLGYRMPLEKIKNYYEVFSFVKLAISTLCSHHAQLPSVA